MGDVAAGYTGDQVGCEVCDILHQRVRVDPNRTYYDPFAKGYQRGFSGWLYEQVDAGKVKVAFIDRSPSESNLWVQYCAEHGRN